MSEPNVRRNEVLVVALVGIYAMLWTGGFGYLNWRLAGSPTVPDLEIAQVFPRSKTGSEEPSVASQTPRDRSQAPGDPAPERPLDDLQRNVEDWLGSFAMRFRSQEEEEPKRAVTEVENGLPPGVVAMNEDWLPVGVTQL